ncbi:MAG: hypothetical protein HXX81_03160, partial [Campylobacterales bacterium]|nr:hypothetical protein [Campylobacterales bacterium]
LKLSDTTQINVKSKIAWAIRKTDKSDIPQKLEIISKNSTLEFYLTKKNRLTFEDLKIKLNEFYQKADNQQFLNYSKEIKKDNQFLLRVGRYCGQKFMVFEPNKFNPKTKTVFRKSEKDNKSESPFGWLLCEIIE